MKPSVLFTVCLFVCSMLAVTAQSEEYKLKSADAPPKGLSDEIKAVLATEGHHVISPEGPLCDLWLVKSIALKEGFQSNLRVKYPMQVGALVGVLLVKDGPEFTDFRDQVIAPGLYTMRYGQQPQDGNHVGTSELADFLLALPIEDDESSETLDDEDELQAISADAAGSAHPAIFSLLPPEEQKEKSALTYDDDHDFWILQTSTGEDQSVTLRLIIVGIGEE